MAKEIKTFKVQAIARGYYGIPGSDSHTGNKKTLTGVAQGTEMIRNPGEVFDMDVRGMDRADKANAKLATNANGGDREVVSDGKVEYVLPTWVVTVKNAELPLEMEAKGHQSIHSAATSQSVI